MGSLFNEGQMVLSEWNKCDSHIVAKAQFSIIFCFISFMCRRLQVAQPCCTAAQGVFEQPSVHLLFIRYYSAELGKNVINA